MNLARIIERWAEHFPAKTALHYEGEDWSYARLWERVEEATRALAASGVTQGERVAFLGANHPDMLVLLFALARLGAILVPLNWRLTAAEHRVIVADCTPRLLCYESEYQAHAAALGIPGRVIGGRWDEGSGSPVLAGSDAHDALIVYTSGATGRPKGAVLQQSALLWNGFNSIHAHDLSQSDHVLTVLPLFHVGGLNNQTLPALLAGATVTLHKRFDPGLWLADVARRRPTMSILVPATMQAIVRHPHWESTDLSSLKMINSGSMVVPDSLIRAFHARGIPVAQIYGCTETAPIAVVLLKEDAYAMIGSAGKPAPHCEVKLATDERGTQAPAGEVGELWVRGPNVMRAYWNDPEATRAAFVDGWFRTGDLARRDANGFIWIAGRSKDVIISGGENIYPAEIESVVIGIPGVSEVAVIGVADEKWGEVACAVVVADQSTVSEQRIVEFCETQLARYKLPKKVIFADEIPRNPAGKVLKQLLREQYR